MNDLPAALRRFMKVWAIAAMATLVPVTASAQGAPDKFYVSAGGSGVSREASAPFGRSWTAAADLAAGFKLNRWAGLEGALEIQRAQSFDWIRPVGTAGDWKETVSDTDIPLVGFFRITPSCGGSFCVEPVVGAGLSIHRAQADVTTDCTPNPNVCQPVAPGTNLSSSSTAEALFAAGVDLPVRLSAGLSIASTVRLIGVRRRDFLLSGNQPGVGSGQMVTVGIALTWHHQ